jgi:Tfp pilus assembly protein PilP
MSVTLRITSMLSGALLVVATAAAQAPAPAAPAGAPAPQAAPAAPGQAAAAQPSPFDSPAYTYDAQGRRDPFISLLRRGTETDRSNLAQRPIGLSGLEAAELVLKGTMESRTGYVALVEGTDKKTYIVKAGDRLLDGTVRTITADAMVIVQQVNDPLSLEKQREVRKMLRQTDEVK